MIYDVNGNALTDAYDVNGNALAQAYDIDGNPLLDLTLKVMTYNVGQWYIGNGSVVPTAKDAQYYALQNAIIGGQDADIITMQEYTKQFSGTGRTAKSLLEQYYPYIHEESGTSNYFGRAIASKYPIVSYTPHIYADDANGRYYDMAVIQIGSRQIDVIVTHLHPSDQSEKIRTAKILFDYAQTLPNPYIIGGDFNSTLKDPFSEVNAAIYNQFLNAGDTIANDGAFGILPTACNSDNWSTEAFAIDNIICSSGITIDAVWTDQTKLTDSIQEGKIDHIPLIAEVTIS